MLTIMSVILIIISILLILVVLIQPGKSDMASGLGGLSGQFTSVFGTRRAMDFLTKFTIGLAISIIVLSLATNKFFVGNNETTMKRAVTEGANNYTAPASQPIQNQPIQQAQPQQKPNGQKKTNSK